MLEREAQGKARASHGRLEGSDILVTSNEPWGPVWYSKHHYAYELSKKNRVIFIDPVKPWRSQALCGPRPRLVPVAQNLWVLQYRNPLPSSSALSFKLNNRIVSCSIGRALRKMGFRTDLLLSFDPSRLYAPALLRAKSSLFVAVDDYIHSMRGERLLYERVDGFLSISEQFNATYQAYGKPLLNISHAISAEEFGGPPSNDMPAGAGLYIGAMDHRLDLPLIQAMAERFPTVPFVFIGPYRLGQNESASRLFRQGAYPNLILRGAVEAKALRGYVSAARFCIAPMDAALRGNAISHHKVFQYLAQGKAVFSPVFSEYTPISSLLYMATGHDAILSQMARYLERGEDPGLEGQRITFARSRTYDALWERIGAFLDGMDGA